MELKKRYSSGLTFGVAYTYSKTHRDGEAGGNLPGALKHILGSWQPNGIVSLRTGFPYQIRASQGDLNVREENPRPDLVGQPAFDG